MTGSTASVQQAPELFAGLVERVTFHNEDTGFCVLRVKARGQRDLVTVIGHAATIAAGEFVQITGNVTDFATKSQASQRSVVACREP